MALTKDKPPGLPSSNDLDKHKIAPVRAELRLGQNVLLAQDNPPDLGETRDVVLRLRCVRKGDEMLSADLDAEVTAFRSMKLVSAWVSGDPIPSEPALVDDEGNVDPDAAADGPMLASVPDPQPGDDEPPI